MSKIGKQPVILFKDVEVAIKNGLLTVKGPKGELSKAFPDVLSISQENEEVKVIPNDNEDQTRALYGTFRSHIANMVFGVSQGFSKKLLIVGIGYRANVEGGKLILQLGFSNPIELTIPEGINIETTKEDITISGIDKEKIGLFAAKIRSFRKPEPYKGKGLRYDDEHVIRKAGKKATE